MDAIPIPKSALHLCHLAEDLWDSFSEEAFTLLLQSARAGCNEAVSALILNLSSGDIPASLVDEVLSVKLLRLANTMINSNDRMTSERGLLLIASLDGLPSNRRLRRVIRGVGRSLFD